MEAGLSQSWIHSKECTVVETRALFCTSFEFTVRTGACRPQTSVCNYLLRFCYAFLVSHDVIIPMVKPESPRTHNKKEKPNCAWFRRWRLEVHAFPELRTVFGLKPWFTETHIPS